MNGRSSSRTGPSRLDDPVRDVNGVLPIGHQHTLFDREAAAFEPPRRQPEIQPEFDERHRSFRFAQRAGCREASVRDRTARPRRTADEAAHRHGSTSPCVQPAPAMRRREDRDTAASEFRRAFPTRTAEAIGDDPFVGERSRPVSGRIHQAPDGIQVNCRTDFRSPY